MTNLTRLKDLQIRDVRSIIARVSDGTLSPLDIVALLEVACDSIESLHAEMMRRGKVYTEETHMIPTIGRLVHYRLSADDAVQINRRRTDGAHIRQRMEPLTVSTPGSQANIQLWPSGAQAHIGNEAHEGDTVPMLIVKTWGDTAESSVNGQAFLDGNDVLWVTSVSVGEGPRTFSWPTQA